MREIEIHDYARQLLEAHGAKAIAEVLVALGCLLPDGWRQVDEETNYGIP